MSDAGEARARRGLAADRLQKAQRMGAAPRRFEQSPRVCVYGCPGLCPVKCLKAGECVAELATYHGRSVAEDVGELEREAWRLAGVLSTVHNLTANVDDTLDLARLLVARGVRALIQ